MSTLKRLAPWCLVTGIILFAIWGVLPFYFSGKRAAGIDQLAAHTRQLCNHRLANGSYPEQFDFPASTPGFKRISYHRNTPQSFLIKAEIQVTAQTREVLQASPRGVFLWSGQEQRWQLEAPADPRCLELR